MCRVYLGLLECIAGIAGAWQVDHRVDTDLVTEGQAEANGDHLIEECEDVISDVGALKVATMPATLALGDGVEGEDKPSMWTTFLNNVKGCISCACRFN
jgi:hypothetical protein